MQKLHQKSHASYVWAVHNALADGKKVKKDIKDDQLELFSRRVYLSFVRTLNKGGSHATIKQPPKTNR